MRLLEISDWRLVIGHAGLTRHLLARFNLDTRIERFLLGHLSAIKAHGKAYVLEQLYETVPPPGAWTSVSDLGTETSARVALHALLDASPRGVAMGSRTREDIARRLLQKQRRAADRDRIESALDFLEQWAAISGTADEIFPVIDHLAGSDDAAKRTIRDLRSVVDLLAVYDIPSAQIRIQPGLVRSWEYYTGVVFELRGDGDLPLGGGGRYDELVRLIGGQEDVPAVGFAYYVDAVLAALPKSDPIRRSALLIPVDATNGNPAARWAQELRLRGVTAVLIPDQSYSHRERLLTVEMDASAQFRGKTYTLAQVSALVAALSETTYDQ
jgi:histidyl-tRNA synthetase